LGGNAFGKGDTTREGKDYWESLRENVAVAAKEIAQLVFQGKKVVITHGNGPQVGYLFGLRPQTHLAHHVLKTQIQMGKLLREEISEALLELDWKDKTIPNILTIQTNVEVDLEDPAFLEPSKPIGWFDKRGAKILAQFNPPWRAIQKAPSKEDGWRLLVPSPKPKRILEIDKIQNWLNEGMIVIAAGGGGVPQTHSGNGLEPVQAVIDKDRVSALLAIQLKAKSFVILTGVSKVSLDFRKGTEKRINEISVDLAKGYLTSGIFPPGSMGPKVEAAIQYTQATGNETIITKLGQLEEALAGKTGTRIKPHINIIRFEVKSRTLLEEAI